MHTWFCHFLTLTEKVWLPTDFEFYIKYAQLPENPLLPGQKSLGQELSMAKTRKIQASEKVILN